MQKRVTLQEAKDNLSLVEHNGGSGFYSSGYWQGYIDGFQAASVLGDSPEAPQWQPIETAPKDGTWILLRGESGYINRPYRVHVGRWDAKYRPKNPWQTSEATSFEDDGEPPTHWMPVPRWAEVRKSSK